MISGVKKKGNWLIEFKRLFPLLLLPVFTAVSDPATDEDDCGESEPFPAAANADDKSTAVCCAHLCCIKFILESKSLLQISQLKLLALLLVSSNAAAATTDSSNVKPAIFDCLKLNF